MAFRSKLRSDITYTLPLDNNYLPDDDIRLFLKDSFDEIKCSHPFARLLGKDWPTTFEVEEIVEKSSGQFIYASVVFKFCAMHSRHPSSSSRLFVGFDHVARLLRLHISTHYTNKIFSQVQDIEVASLSLAWTLINIPHPLTELAAFWELEIGDIYSALSPLQSVIEYISCDPIKFLHRSLPDFLLDKERSQKYNLNLSAWRGRLSIAAHKIVAEKQFPRTPHKLIYWAIHLIILIQSSCFCRILPRKRHRTYSRITRSYSSNQPRKHQELQRESCFLLSLYSFYTSAHSDFLLC